MIISLATGSGGENTSDKSISTIVAEIIAKHKGVDPADLEPLYTTIDPEALEALFAPRTNGTARNSGQVQFTHAEYEVTVKSDRTVDVKPIDDEK